MTSIHENLGKKYPKTNEITSDDVGVRCFEHLCRKTHPRVTQSNIHTITGQNADWVKRIRKGGNTSLNNGLTFVLHRCDTVDEALEFLWLHGIDLCDGSLCNAMYLEGLEIAFNKESKDGEERCEYFNSFVLSKGITNIFASSPMD